MKRVFNKTKRILSKINFKSPKLIIGVLLVLLAIFSAIMMISYSRYTKTVGSEDLVDGLVSIAGADIELRVYIQNRNGDYRIVGYLPGVGYDYAADKTDCTPGITIKSYDSEGIEIEATNRGRCNVYFDVNDDLPNVVYNIIDQQNRRYDDIPDDGYVYILDDINCIGDDGEWYGLDANIYGNELFRDDYINSDSDITGVCDVQVLKTDIKTAVQTIREKSKAEYDYHKWWWDINHGYRYVAASGASMNNFATFNGDTYFIIGAVNVDYYIPYGDSFYTSNWSDYDNIEPNHSNLALKLVYYDGLLDNWCDNCLDRFVDITDEDCNILDDMMYNLPYDTQKSIYIAKWPYIYGNDTYNNLFDYMTIDEAYEAEKNLNTVMSPIGMPSLADFNYSRTFYNYRANTAGTAFVGTSPSYLDDFDITYSGWNWTEYEAPSNIISDTRNFILPYYGEGSYTVEDEIVYYPSIYVLRGAYFDNPDAAGTLEDPYEILIR